MKRFKINLFFKTLFSIILVSLLSMSSFTSYAVQTQSISSEYETAEKNDGLTEDEYKYTVQASYYLFGDIWQSMYIPECIMTKVGDIYSYTLEKVTAIEKIVSLKIVETNLKTGEARFIGDKNGDYIYFRVNSDCDITFTFDPATDEINVIGDGVEMVHEFIFDYLRVVGNGYGSWLNSATWDYDEDLNTMYEVSDNIFTANFRNLVPYDDYNFLICTDGNSVFQWGGKIDPSLTQTSGNTTVYSGKAVFDAGSYDSIHFALDGDVEDRYTVSVTLDLNNFDFNTKEGAVFTIQTKKSGSAEPTTTIPTPSILMGDVTGEGKVNIADATEIQKNIAGFNGFTDEQAFAADTNKDGFITIVDVTIIQKYLVGLVKEL